MAVEIVEVISRSRQGITKPFICRGDDEQIYFVKGRDAGRRSLICEWIAGQLGLRLGLPIAPFEIVEVSAELLSMASHEVIRDLGIGKAFGSRAISVTELKPSQIAGVPAQVQRDVLAFDWWVCNSDRTLGESGGNPNLFLNTKENTLVVIDHNQAFDPACSAEKFINLHAFWGQAPTLFNDWIECEHYADRFQQAMTDWTAICESVPPEWYYVDAEQTVPTDFDCRAIQQHLLSYQTDAFWKIQ
jgi:hypothetical protein